MIIYLELVIKLKSYVTQPKSNQIYSNSKYDKIKQAAKLIISNIGQFENSQYSIKFSIFVPAGPSFNKKQYSRKMDL